MGCPWVGERGLVEVSIAADGTEGAGGVNVEAVIIEGQVAVAAIALVEGLGLGLVGAGLAAGVVAFRVEVAIDEAWVGECHGLSLSWSR